MFDVGRICLKTAGREAGSYCCIVNTVDAQHVLVTGPREVTAVRRRKCNISHLEPTGELITIAADASDGDVFAAYERANLFDKLSLEKPTPEQIEQLKQRKAEKLARKEQAEPAKPAKAAKEARKPKKERKAETTKEAKAKDGKKADKPKEATKETMDAKPAEPEKAEEKT